MEKSKSWIKGFVTRKRLSGHYPVVIDADPDLNIDEFISGLRFGGYYGEVRFSGLQ